MAGDLHNHTTFSDGSQPAAALPRLAAAAGLTHLAISDHDSLAGVRYGWSHPTQDGVSLVPAVELSGYDLARGQRVHLLCYWPVDCKPLQEHCQTMARRRAAAVTQSMAELEALCPQFRAQDALAYAGHSEGALYKAYVMRAMMEYGLADSLYGDTYHKYFGKGGRGGPVSHAPEYPSHRELLALARACCGVIVLAHPSVYHSMALARELAAAGQIDGVEIDHPRNTPEDRAELEALARAHGLIVTGGTDYHGMNARRPNPIGTGRTTDEMVQRIARLAQSRREQR